MNSTKKTARIAGALYLVNGVTGFFSIIYVPSKLFVSGNAAATAHNILASERLFRLGIASEVICAVEYIYLLWVLYRLLTGVSKTHAYVEDHCTFCSRAINFCAKFWSDSDHNSRALAPAFFSTLLVNSTSLCTLARTLAAASMVIGTSS